MTKSAIERLRLDIISALGGCCVKCGFHDPRALQIDHINGGGRREYLRFGGSSHRYLKHIRDQIEKGSKKYQILCANDNMIKREVNKKCEGAGRRASATRKRNLERHRDAGLKAADTRIRNLERTGEQNEA